MSDRDQVPNRAAFAVTLFCGLLFLTAMVWHQAITFDPPFVRFELGRGPHDNPISLSVGTIGFLVMSSPFLACFYFVRGKVGASRRDMLTLGSAGILVFAISMAFLVAAIKSYHWCDWDAFSATLDSDMCFVWRYDEADRSLNHSALSR